MKLFLPIILTVAAGCSAASANGQKAYWKQSLQPKTTFSITHLITATSVFHINDVNLLTDPFFSPANTSFPGTPLTNANGPALQPNQIPVIDAVLLSHEDHPDNLDDIGRTHFLDGRKVYTTTAGAANLSPRPGVKAIKPWETITVKINGENWKITGTPCVHVPGGEVVGFVLEGPGFGSTNGLPNAIWYSGDTIYIPELDQLKEKFHIRAAVINVGDAQVPLDGTPLQITMNGDQAAELFKAINADVLVPMHYDSWAHFQEKEEQVREAFNRAGIADKVRWLTLGQSTRIF